MVALALVASLVFGARRLHPFLAVNAPVRGGVLVVEGWAPDWAMEEAAAEFRQHHYDMLFVTGIPIERGVHLCEYKTYAELGAATLLKLGLGTNVVQAVPTPGVRVDRTYASAAALKRWLREHGMAATRLNLITSGVHARRSRLLYQKAFGKGVEVGVMAAPVKEYDAGGWWRSSAGFRLVIGETLAYGYARVLFRAPKD